MGVTPPPRLGKIPYFFFLFFLKPSLINVFALLLYKFFVSAHFKGRKLTTISTQEINALGSNWRKRPVASSSQFKAKLVKARGEKNTQSLKLK